ncbi:alkaline phosphatase family protein [Clostridium sp. 'deep sea']|uniref:alkaline phosphatase family protein n=1 Tax=Clostridium sp. 'deep sea' TaxID=2779445 RepID=UPI0018964D58|nr:alkaline phosphatase family protein [Clostridium sp. 'deep sea']QOR35404.1 alkaline phosphatase family protein [Clostridium sp. 'deep sea']
MKKTLIIVITIFLLFTGCKSSNDVLPDLTIRGDISQVIKLNDIWEELKTEKIEYNSEKIMAIKVQDLLNKIELLSSESEIYFKAVDRFTIKLTAKTMSNTYIGYSPTKKWVYISKKHPVNSGIKNISEMIIVNSSQEKNYEKGLNIIVANKTIHYSTGQLLTMPYTVQNFSDGISRKEADGAVYTVDVMQQRKVLELTNFVKEPIKSTLVMDSQGEYEYITCNGLVEVSDKGINYITQDKTYRDIVGIMVNPPQTTVMDCFNDSLHYLKQNTDVMVLFIDGFSYNQYLTIKDNKDLFIANLQNVKKANTVFKPVTNAGFAAMITGEPPKVNGVLNRDYRELKVATIFDKASELNKKAILIEGNINILKTNLMPTLNIDLNNSGSNDDEIYNTALAEIDQGYNLFFVHFHSVDDYGHNYGDMNAKTLANIKLIDSYVKTLVEKWSGKVILVADHGMHTTADGGSHGEFRAEDLFIPYAVFEGGKN